MDIFKAFIVSSPLLVSALYDENCHLTLESISATDPEQIAVMNWSLWNGIRYE